jgi:hypothetical protein
LINFFQFSNNNFLKIRFWGLRICLLCDASTDKSQTCFKETDFNMYTKASYNKLVNDGIFKYCVLNESPNFHILENFAFDMTHDLWLGVVQNELGLVLSSLIDQKLFTLDFLNARIKSFNYGNTDIGNRPNLLFMPDKSTGVKIKQKAAKTACLFKLLPFMLGKYFTNLILFKLSNLYF